MKTNRVLLICGGKGSWSVTLCFGKVMWHCTNGAAKYRHEWWLRFGWGIDRPDFAIFLTPALRYLPWHKGVLSEIKALGTTSNSASLWLDWLCLQLQIMIGHSQNLKEMTRKEVASIGEFSKYE